MYRGPTKFDVALAVVMLIAGGLALLIAVVGVLLALIM